MTHQSVARQTSPITFLGIALLAVACSAGAQPSGQETAEMASSAAIPAGDGAAFAAAADALIENTLARLRPLPGLAATVVVGDEVVYLRAFGHSDVEAGIAATTDTDYYIASSTKSYMALAAAMLHDQGKIDLETTLREAFPEADFDAAVRADEVTLRDLLTHTSGINNRPIGFRVAFSGDHTPAKLRELVAASSPNRRSPYGTFQYTNIGYNLLAVYLDEATGTPWQLLLQEMIFAPAGLERTTAYVSRIESNGWPIARPYYAVGRDQLERLYLEKRDNTMQSAGGLMSTAEDMGRWLRLQLNDGRLDGKQIVPAHVIAETHRQQADTDGSFGSFGRSGYGLGWYIGDHEGETVLHHFGGFSGFRAHVSFMPAHDIGVAVLINEALSGTAVADLIASFAYDWWRGAENFDPGYGEQIEALAQRQQQGFERVVASRADLARRQWTLTQPVAAYTGTYESPLLGTLVIALANDTLAVSIGNMHSSSTPFTSPDSIRVILAPPGGQVVEFEVADSGEVTAARYAGARFVRTGR